jgi:V/A-type H+/Na+-transporting ATPase subunit E
VGYPALLKVLEEEASREVREVRAAAEREAAGAVARAREEARAAREALLARERASLEARRRNAAEAIDRDRERSLLAERRRHLEALRAEVLRRLRGAGSPELDARLLAELVPEIGDGPFELVVDPGAEDAARAALARIAPAAAERASVRAAPAPRGGVAVVTGRRELDDTLPARLERAWPDLEAELAAELLGEA